MAAHWKKEIGELELAITLEEENYRIALQSQTAFYSLKRIRLNLKKLKGELQIFLDREAAHRILDTPGKKISN